MSIEWDNLSANTVADLKYECGRHGIKVTSHMRKDQIIQELEKYKAKHKSVVKKSENVNNNTMESDENLMKMMMRIAPPKLPSVTPNRERKSMWLHTPSQIFLEKGKDIPIVDTPAFRSKAHEMTKHIDEKETAPVIKQQKIVEEPISFNVFTCNPEPSEPYMTPDVGNKVVTPVIKTISPSSPAIIQRMTPQCSPKIASIESKIKSPRITDRIENVQPMPVRRRGKSRCLVVFVFTLFITTVAVLLFLSQTL